MMLAEPSRSCRTPRAVGRRVVLLSSESSLSQYYVEGSLPVAPTLFHGSLQEDGDDVKLSGGHTTDCPTSDLKFEPELGPDDPMDEKHLDAYRVLGLKPGATEVEIEQASADVTVASALPWQRF
jgi:hypothetical protein